MPELTWDGWLGVGGSIVALATLLKAGFSWLVSQMHAWRRRPERRRQPERPREMLGLRLPPQEEITDTVVDDDASSICVFCLDAPAAWPEPVCADCRLALHEYSAM